MHTAKRGTSWFGAVFGSNGVMASTLAATRENALHELLESLPPNISYQILHEPTPETEHLIDSLYSIHQGLQAADTIPLSLDHYSSFVAKTLQVASHIPIGYVTTYGAIAKIAGTSPRVVGRIMAGNPLYPLVPCHRVIGSNLTLVGYGGQKNKKAITTKLTRLKQETRNLASRSISIAGSLLPLIPVEEVIIKAEKLARKNKFA